MSSYPSSSIRGVILEVPFKEKELVKELGAWWDPEIKKWFVPRGRDAKPFSRWFARDDDGDEKRRLDA